jgi:hypothetical protein
MVWKVWIVRSIAYLLYLAAMLSLLIWLVIIVANFKRFEWLWMWRAAIQVGGFALAGLLLDLLADIGKRVGRLYQEETF